MNTACLPMTQRGVALGIVVWFIAGMSLLVAGIMASSRTDVRLAQLHLARAKATAVGDGAVKLMMANYVSQRSTLSRSGPVYTGQYRIGDADVEVVLVPGSMLINLNAASAGSLAGLFVAAGGLDQVGAKSLADNVVKWRESSPEMQVNTGYRGASRFESVEDLLRVEGMTRTLMDSIRNYVAAGGKGAGRAGEAIAPQELVSLLTWTGPGNAGLSRGSNNAAAGQDFSDSGPQGPAGSSIRLDAHVQYGDQVWLRRHWIAMGDTRGSRLPWYGQRTEPARIYLGSPITAGGSSR